MTTRSEILLGFALIAEKTGSPEGIEDWLRWAEEAEIHEKEAELWYVRHKQE